MCSTSCLLAVWFSENNRRDVYMESTGNTGFTFTTCLNSFVTLSLLTPRTSKSSVARKSTSAALSGLTRFSSTTSFLKVLFCPTKFGNYATSPVRYKFTNISVGEKNRAQNSLTVFKFDNVFLDVFGKSGSAIKDMLPVCPKGNFNAASLVAPKCQTPIDKIQVAVGGFICTE